MLNPGTLAPDFELRNHTGGTTKLSDFRGKKNVVIAFHPLAFTPVCAVQVQTSERERARLDAVDAHVLIVSNDASPSKKAWADSLGGVTYDLLSDYYPHGAVAEQYGVLRPDGLSERALFVVDKHGKIVWTKLHTIPEQPDFEELLGQLQRLG